MAGTVSAKIGIGPIFRDGIYSCPITKENLIMPSILTGRASRGGDKMKMENEKTNSFDCR